MSLRWRAALAGLATIATLALASCASVADRVDAALDSASSATASASTALGLLDDGRALPPFTDTVLGDAITELDDATTDLTGSGPLGDAAAAERRDDALAEIRAATDALLAARETVARRGDLAGDIRAVDAATDRLHTLRAEPGT
jgi:hypothetical protein